MASQDDDVLIAAVRLLFQRIDEGKARFDAERVPKTLEALDAVEFDERGNPILSTITSPVRALANMIYVQEIEVLVQEAEKRERDSPVHALLGTPIPVDEEVLRNCAEKGTYSAVAFELYKEAGIVLTVCAHSYTGAEAGEDALSRDQVSVPVCSSALRSSWSQFCSWHQPPTAARSSWR